MVVCLLGTVVLRLYVPVGFQISECSVETTRGLWVLLASMNRLNGPLESFVLCLNVNETIFLSIQSN